MPPMADINGGPATAPCFLGGGAESNLDASPDALGVHSLPLSSVRAVGRSMADEMRQAQPESTKYQRGVPMMRISFAVAVTAAAGILLVQPTSGQSTPEELGEVHF